MCHMRKFSFFKVINILIKTYIGFHFKSRLSNYFLIVEFQLLWKLTLLEYYAYFNVQKLDVKI